MSTYTPTADRVRSFFDYVPKGARYYLTTLRTPAGGAAPEGTKDRLDRLCRELRAAARDSSVGNITVLLMYDPPSAEMESRAIPEQPILPLGR